MKYIHLIISLLILLFFINLVNAVSVSSPYSSKNSLEMYAGESKDIVFTLQNMAGEGDVRFKVNLSEGFEIISLIDNDEYLVPLGANDIKVNARVKIPRDVVIGTEYPVYIVFEPLEGGGEDGMIQFSIGLSKYFIVKVIEKPTEVEPEGISMIWIILGIVIVVIIILLIWFVVKGRKETIEKGF